MRRGLHLEDIRVGYSDILAEEKVNAIATHWLSPTPLLIEGLMLVGKFPSTTRYQRPPNFDSITTRLYCFNRGIFEFPGNSPRIRL